jgi:hypothetical protein
VRPPRTVNRTRPNDCIYRVGDRGFGAPKVRDVITGNDQARDLCVGGRPGPDGHEWPLWSNPLLSLFAHLVNTFLGNLKRALGGTYHAFDFAKNAHGLRAILIISAGR